MKKSLPPASPEELAWLERQIEQAEDAFSQKPEDIGGEELEEAAAELLWLYDILAHRRYEATGESQQMPLRTPIRRDCTTHSGQTVSVLDYGCGIFSGSTRYRLENEGPAIGERVTTQQMLVQAATRNWFDAYHARAYALHQKFKSEKSRQRLTVLEKHTGLKDKEAAALAVKKKLLEEIKKLQQAQGLDPDEKPKRWAEHLAKTFYVDATKIREALPDEDRPWFSG